jgi:hypothetical protein
MTAPPTQGAGVPGEAVVEHLAIMLAANMKELAVTRALLDAANAQLDEQRATRIAAAISEDTPRKLRA